MNDTRNYLNRLDAAAPYALTEILRKPTPEQEQALRTYLGHERYRRQRGLALRRFSRLKAGAKLGSQRNASPSTAIAFGWRSDRAYARASSKWSSGESGSCPSARTSSVSACSKRSTAIQ